MATLKNTSLVFIGAPGSGKGTQAKLLSEKFSYVHISTGDILREQVALKSELGKKVDELLKAGALVDDDLMIKLIETKLTSLNDSFILDGFPRTMEQSKSLLELLERKNIDFKVVYFKIDSHLLIDRLVNRRLCAGCGAIFNLLTDKLLSSNCPKCGGELNHRKDDTAEVVTSRIKLYEGSTLPVIEFYKNNGEHFIEIDSSKEEAVVFNDIKKCLLL